MNETLFRENQVSRTASGVQYRAGLFGVPRSRGLQSALPGLPAKGGTPNSADRIVCATTGLFLVNVTLFRENQVSRTPLGVQYRAGLFGVPRSRGSRARCQDLPPKGGTPNIADRIVCATAGLFLVNEMLFQENRVSQIGSGVPCFGGLFGVPRSRGLQSALPGLPSKGGTPNTADRIVCATTRLFL